MGCDGLWFKGEMGLRVQDFGRFDDEVTLFGGPYSNVHALRALVSHQNGAPAICTGDIVAYCADPVETVALMRGLNWPVVTGNCEIQIAEDAPDCGCGFEEGMACELLSRTWYPYARDALDDAAKGWMGALPMIGTFAQQDRRYAVIHGGITAINRFLWPSSDAGDFKVEIAAIEKAVGPVNGIVAGHCGIPFHRWIGAHHWINAGVIGLPPHDGRPATRFATLKDGDVRFHHLDYDHASARAAMEAAGLVQGYHRALETGIWPSEDILPNELRAQSTISEARAAL